MFACIDFGRHVKRFNFKCRRYLHCKGQISWWIYCLIDCERVIVWSSYQRLGSLIAILSHVLGGGLHNWQLSLADRCGDSHERHKCHLSAGRKSKSATLGSGAPAELAAQWNMATLSKHRKSGNISFSGYFPFPFFPPSYLFKSLFSKLNILFRTLSFSNFLYLKTSLDTVVINLFFFYMSDIFEGAEIFFPRPLKKAQFHSTHFHRNIE